MSFCDVMSHKARHDHQETLCSSCVVGDHDGRLGWVSSANTSMLFTKKLRARVKSGEVTASVRIWQRPHVRVGGKYRLEEGYIEVTSIRQILWEDLSDSLAREGGFRNLIDLLKTAKHGSGQCVYYVRFRYRTASAKHKAK
jgi:hypothetical protein